MHVFVTYLSEIDISVSKLLGFETFANFDKVSVSENLVSEKSLGFGFGKFGLRKQVSVLVSEKSWRIQLFHLHGPVDNASRERCLPPPSSTHLSQ